MTASGKKSFGYTYLIVIALTIIILFIITAGLKIVDSRTNTIEYCTSCHAMKFPAEEFQKSKHYKSKVGILPNCVDCHIPRGDSIAKFKRIIGDSLSQLSAPKTKEDYEKVKPALAKKVRDELHQNDSAPCRNCHVAQAMKSENEDATSAHKKMVEEKKTCIDCHYNLAHGKVEVEKSQK